MKKTKFKLKIFNFDERFHNPWLLFSFLEILEVTPSGTTLKIVDELISSRIKKKSLGNIIENNYWLGNIFTNFGKFFDFIMFPIDVSNLNCFQNFRKKILFERHYDIYHLLSFLPTMKRNVKWCEFLMSHKLWVIWPWFTIFSNGETIILSSLIKDGLNSIIWAYLEHRWSLYWHKIIYLQLSRDLSLTHTKIFIGKRSKFCRT